MTGQPFHADLLWGQLQGQLELSTQTHPEWTSGLNTNPTTETSKKKPVLVSVAKMSHMTGKPPQNSSSKRDKPNNRQQI